MKTDPNEEYDLAMQLVETTGKNIFLTGRAGTGKTTFLRELRQRAVKRMVVLAPTGIAAINAGGATVHSFFQLPFGLYLPGYHRRNKFRIGMEKIEIMRSIDLLVIDEVSMLRADLLDEVSSLLQRYRRNPEPFGGVQLLLIGDLQQLSPIVKEEEWQEMGRFYASPYFFESQALQAAGFCCVELKTVYRQADKVFVGLLEKIRNRNLDPAAMEMLSSRYIPGFVPPEGEGFITLTTHNFQSDAINQERLAALPGEETVYEATLSGNFPASSFPTRPELRFKPGAQVMFVKNDTGLHKRYYNGKIGRVLRCLPDRLWVESEREEIEVRPESWENVRYRIDQQGKEIVEEVEGCFSQIPLKLAWAITIHKSQGLTFDKVVVDAGRSFAHGQVYVALSRCRSLQGVVLRSPLTRESLIADFQLENFGKDAEYAAGRSELSLWQADYCFRMLRQQFDFSYLWDRIGSLAEFSGRSLRSLYPRLDEDIRNMSGLFGKEVWQVAGLFAKELYALRLSSERQRNERCYKAAVYFSDKLEELLLPLLPRLVVEIENRQHAGTLSRLRKEIRDGFREKQDTLLLIVRHRSFDLSAFLRGRSAAGKTERGPERKSRESDVASVTGLERKKESLKSSVPGFRPEEADAVLVEELKAWRLQKCREEGKPAYRVLSQKALLSIASDRPGNEAELLSVKGIGPVKVAEYGAEILQIVAQHQGRR